MTAREITVLLDCRMATHSGIGRYTVQLTRALASTGQLRLIQVCAPGVSPPVREGAQATVIRAFKSPFHPSGALELGRIAQTAPADIVHCLHFPTPVPARHPLVVTIHDITPLRAPGVMNSWIRRAAYTSWMRRAVNTADALLVDSRFTATDVAHEFSLRRAKLYVVPLGADGLVVGEPVSRPDDPPVPGRPYVLSMGNTRSHKGLPTLLRAFAAVHHQYPSLQLLLVGDHVPGYVAGILGSDPATGSVSFTGPLSDPALLSLYAGAVAFIFPSSYEGFGLPPLEAMRAGAPVICSSAAALPEAVGRAALLFPAGDEHVLATHLGDLLGSETLRIRLRNAGLRRAAEFTWRATADATLRVYRSLLR